VEGKGGADSITKEVCKVVLWLRLLYADYIVYKKSGIDKIKIIAECRVVKFEEKALKRDNRRLLIECIEAREKETSSKE